MFDEVDIRCGRCTYQLVDVDQDPLLATINFNTSTPTIRVSPKLEGEEMAFWNQFKVGDGPDLPRGGVLWQEPERDGEGIILPCRRCHAAAKVSEQKLITQARLARRKGRRVLLLNPSGEIRSA